MSLANPSFQALGWALIHFLWQGWLIWLGVSLALRQAESRGPRVRYGVACAGLALCLLAPVATYAHLRPALAQETGELARDPLPRAAAAGPEPRPSAARRAGELPRRARFLIEDHLPLLLRCWFLGALVLALRFGGGWLYLLRMGRSATRASGELRARFDRLAGQLHVPGPVRLALSPRTATPMVVGFLRPLLLIPVGLVASMDPVGLEALLVHELAHIRRHDYFVNVVQCLVEIMLFFHPAVWLISRRVRAERELCCDDAAVAWCRDPLLYAETLTRLHAFRTETFSPAVAAGGGDLMFRIKRLLVPQLKPSTIPVRFNLLALACSLGLVLGVGMSLNAMQARTAEDGKWFLAGSSPKEFALTLDAKAVRDGKPSPSIACTVAAPRGFGTIMQNLVPTDYLGKRVRMSAWVRTEKVTGWAGLWMRVDGAGNKSLAFDNMGKRPIKGTTDWQPFEVVLDVAPQARNIAFGLLVDGPGQAWVSGLRFETVDAGVAVTPTAGGPTRALPADLSPDGWMLAGSRPDDYAISLDPAQLRDGKPARLLASTARQCRGFGTLMQMYKGSAFLGKRVRLTLWVKTEKVDPYAGVWMRIDGPDGKSTAFDNMYSRPIKGTLGWHPCQVVLDMAPDATALALGILLNGKGKVWIGEPQLEVVDASVPVTDMKK